MQLCKEICDIARSLKTNTIGGQLNKLKMLSKHLSNTPDLDLGKREEDDLDDDETVYNKLHPSLPTDSPCNQTQLSQMFLTWKDKED